MAIHISSAAVICLGCGVALEIELVFKHLNRFHNLSRAMRNGDVPSISEATFKEGLMVDGAAPVAEMNNLYMFPLQHPLPEIKALPIEKGYMCPHCPVPEFTATAYFSTDENTLKRHMRSVHGSVSAYVSCYVQTLFKKQSLKRYFRVIREYSGERVESTVNAEGRHVMSTFFSNRGDQRLGSYFKSNYESNNQAVGDARMVPRFYQEVRWYTLIEKVAGEDSHENRMILFNWVTIKTNHSDRYYSFLISSIKHYFCGIIMNILNDESRDLYHWRKRVMKTEMYVSGIQQISILPILIH